MFGEVLRLGSESGLGSRLGQGQWRVIHSNLGKEVRIGIGFGLRLVIRSKLRQKTRLRLSLGVGLGLVIRSKLRKETTLA